MQPPADRRAVVPGIRDHELQRLAARFHARAHLFNDQAAVAVLVQLVDQRHVHALAVQAAMLRTHRAQEPVAADLAQVVRRHPHGARQLGRRLDHLARVGKREPRLLARRGGAVHLGARFAVGQQAIPHHRRA